MWAARIVLIVLLIVLTMVLHTTGILLPFLALFGGAIGFTVVVALLIALFDKAFPPKKQFDRYGNRL